MSGSISSRWKNISTQVDDIILQVVFISSMHIFVSIGRSGTANSVCTAMSTIAAVIRTIQDLFMLILEMLRSSNSPMLNDISASRLCMVSIAECDKLALLS